MMYRYKRWNESLNKIYQASMTLKKVSSVSVSPIRHKTMLSVENELPHLPVPPLKQTMDKYIYSLEPIMFENEYEDTKKVVKEFSKPGGIGEHLQSELIKRANKYDNWLTDWWNSCAYFGYRSSVVINSSPGVAFPEQQFETDLDQFRYAAKVIHAVMDFKSRVDSESIPVQYHGKSPLSMIQYKNILSTCRVPYFKEDYAVFATPEESRHVIVAHNNHFFKLDVFNGSHLLSEDELVYQLKQLVDMSQEEEDFPVGVLTSQDRNIWAQGYKRLCRDPQNQENIDQIQKSVFCINLDQDVPIPTDGPCAKYESQFHSAFIGQALHGGGSEQNSMNRWFDKTLQINVNRNGMVSACYEHSAAEGPPVMDVGNAIMKIDFKSDPSYSLPSNIDMEPPEKLNWNLDYDLVDRIELAKDYIDSTTGDLEMCLCKFDDFGKNVPKKYRISPDAFFQVSLQLAYYRLHMHHPPTYESASIRKFARGRTETIRSATPECARYVREMDRDRLTTAEKRALFMRSIDAHVKYTIEASNFEAVDRHMLGLKLIALEKGMPLPEIFRDKAFGYALHFRLSTSQVPSPYEAALVFGAVVPDGYGVCYNPMENQFIYAITAFYSHPKTQARDLGDCLSKALQDNHALLASQSKL